MNSFRLLHVLFGVTVLAAYFTAEETGVLHAWIGYVAAGLIALRVVLGLAGRAGFSFHRLTPRLSAAPRNLGGIRHPFIAQALTLVLALVVTTSAVTGIMMDQGGTFVGKSVRHEEEGERDGRHGKGGDREHDEEDELSASLFGLVPAARADDGEGGEGEEEGPLAEVHEVAGNVILPLAILHVLYMLLFRFDLARFMLFASRRRTTP